MVLDLLPTTVTTVTILHNNWSFTKKHEAIDALDHQHVSKQTHKTEKFEEMHEVLEIKAGQIE